MDKKDVVHIYNRILLGHVKEQHWVIHRDVGGPSLSYKVKSARNRKPNIAYSCVYVGPGKMV